MDNKFKVIFFVFILVALLYILHFVLSYMNNQRRQEMFTEEKESYDETPPVQEENKDYMLRMKVLEDVDKLDVKDKIIKAKLVDYLFSDPIIKDLSSKNPTDMFMFIQTTYTNMVGTQSSVIQEENYIVPGVLPPKEAFDQEAMASVDAKVDELMKHVSNLHASVDELKNISRQNKKYPSMLVEQEDIALPNFIPPPSPTVPVVAPTTVPMKPSVKPAVPGESIEGFENTKKYAFL